MLTLVNILIIFFICIILYQIILANNSNLPLVVGKLHLVEGFKNKYKSYDTNNPNNAIILAQQNAGNISYLKERIDNVQGVYQQVQDLSGNVQNLQTQVNGLLQAQQAYANQMTGGTPPEISGTIEMDEDEDEVEDDNVPLISL
jgi:TolA-binding protein